MNNRTPLKRENGRYVDCPKGIEEFAEEVVKNMSEKYPDIDLIDLEFIFSKQLSFQFSRKLLEELTT